MRLDAVYSTLTVEIFYLAFFPTQQHGQFVDCILTGLQLYLMFQWIKRPCFTKAVKYKLHLKGCELKPRLFLLSQVTKAE